MVPFEANKFRPFMDEVVRPWLQEHAVGGQFPGYDGNMIQFYHADHPSPRGIIVMLHGFCGFFGKFHEVVYNFYEHGYSVYFMEHRGHGLSYRPVKETDMVDIRSFDEYVADVRSFLDTTVLPCRKEAEKSSGKAVPLFLYAHSMGGCVGTMFLEKYPEAFDAAILTSPMLKINFGKTPLWKMKLIALMTKVLGWNDRFVPGQGPFNGVSDMDGSGAQCQARYDYSFEMRADPKNDHHYTTNGASCRWARASLKATLGLDKDESGLTMPILICQAGRDTYVENSAEDKLSRTAKNARLVSFPDAKHEIYNAEGKILEKYYRTIFEFLDRQAEKG